MGNNLEILKEWKNSLSCYQELNINEAKELYKTSVESNTKNNYINELIMGTLYVVINFISTKGLVYLNSSTYDMNDVISVCNEIWINKINSGKLLQINSFTEMFDGDFYNKLCDGLGIQKYSMEDLNFNLDLFVQLLVDYMKIKETENNFNCLKFIEYLKKSEKYKNIFWRMYYYPEHIDYYEIYNLCEIFDGIIESFEFDESTIEISKTNIDKLKHILISNGFEYIRPDINSIVVEDTAETIINDYSRKQIVDIVMNSHLSDSHKEILIKRYGLLDNERHTFEEIAKEQGLTRERIRQKEAKALRTLRHPGYVKKLKELM